MLKLSKLLSPVKSKIVALTAVGTLVLVPSGVAFAHGGYNGNDGGDRQNHSQPSRDDDHNDKNKNSGWWDKWRKNHGEQQPQTTCEQRQANANQKVADYKTKAEQHQNGLALFLSNQQTFVESNNLTIEKYADLSQAANDAKIKSSDAIAAIQAPTIDCNQSEKKDDDQVNSSLSEARKALKRFEQTTQYLSIVIADKIVVS